MIIITEEDKVKFESLMNITRLDNTQKILMKNLCSKYDMKGCNYCSSCDAIVRQAYNKLVTFYTKNKDNKDEQQESK